jgi:hypothetical protein
MKIWMVAATVLMAGNLVWTVNRIGHGEAWGLTFIVFDFFMLGKHRLNSQKKVDMFFYEELKK